MFWRTDMSEDEYLLGRSSEELKRLGRQAALIEAETESLFRSAGIGSGHNVLEIGSGAGDVAMLAGRLVRPNGSVLGIEMSNDSAALANARISAAGNLPVTVEVGNLDSYEPTVKFDALIGRFVLPYLRDPVSTLARLAAHVRPGGVVAFLEFDVRWIGSDPEVPLMVDINRWIVGAFELRGVAPALGSSLGAIFHAAGLQWPFASSFQKASCGPDGILWYFSELVRTLAVEIATGGLATEAEIDIATLETRLEAEVVARKATVYSPRWVSCWARIPFE